MAIRLWPLGTYLRWDSLQPLRLCLTTSLCISFARTAAEAATPLRHVLVRDPASMANGLDPRLARDSLGQVVAFIARLEVGGQLSVDAPPRLSRLKMPRLHGPPDQAPAAGLMPATAPAVAPVPADVAPLPVGGVPAHLLKRSKSHKTHMRRDAAKRRWRQAQREKEVALAALAGSAQV